MLKSPSKIRGCNAKPRPSRPVGVRLLHTVDAYLRKKQRGKGDMSKLIMEAVSRTDLRLVPLITIHGRRQPTVAKVTQIVMPNDIRQLIEHWSENRRCSMNELLNSALVVSLLKPRPEKSRERSRQEQTPTFDSMTAKEREGFFARLLALTIQEAGPDPRSREGNGIESSKLLWK